MKGRTKGYSHKIRANIQSNEPPRTSYTAYTACIPGTYKMYTKYYCCIQHYLLLLLYNSTRQHHPVTLVCSRPWQCRARWHGSAMTPTRSSSWQPHGSPVNVLMNVDERSSMHATALVLLLYYYYCKDTGLPLKNRKKC